MSLDPKLKYCGCGYRFYVSSWQKLRMLLFGDIVITCPRCGNRMRFRLVYHCVKISTKENKERKELWKQC